MGVPRSPIVEVVVVLDEHCPRTCSLWKLGRVTDVIASNDGQVGGAVVKVMTNGKPITLRRPISCLYPLEVMPSSDTDVPNPNITNVIETINDVDDSVAHSRPVSGEAARKPRQQVYKWMTEQTDY